MLWLQSEECLQKTLETVKVLAKPSDQGPKSYLLTGATMQKLAKQLLGLRYPSCYTVLLQGSQLTFRYYHSRQGLLFSLCGSTC